MPLHDIKVRKTPISTNTISVFWFTIFLSSDGSRQEARFTDWTAGSQTHSTACAFMFPNASCEGLRIFRFCEGRVSLWPNWSLLCRIQSDVEWDKCHWIQGRQACRVHKSKFYCGEGYSAEMPDKGFASKYFESKRSIFLQGHNLLYLWAMGHHNEPDPGVIAWISARWSGSCDHMQGGTLLNPY